MSDYTEYRICWKPVLVNSKLDTGDSGWYPMLFSAVEMDAAIKELNTNCPEWEHWIEYR